MFHRQLIVIRFHSAVPYAVCLGGEEALLKSVGSQGLAGSNPVGGAKGSKIMASLLVSKTRNRLSSNLRSPAI